MNNKILLIIPARSGSKGIHKKNIQPICGYPMLEFTLRTAASMISENIRAVCTSDDQEMKNMALAHGVEAPFLRPDELSQDHSSVADAVRHTLDWYAMNENFDPEWIVLLQPTSPFRSAFHVKQALLKIVDSDRDSLFSVNIPNEHPCNYLIKGNESFSWVIDRPKEEGRQSWPEAWFVNGAIFITRVSYFNDHHRFFDEFTLLYEMNRYDGIDINYPEDLDFANWVYQKYYQESNEIPFSQMTC